MPEPFRASKALGASMSAKEILSIALISAVTVAIAMRIDMVRSLVAPGTGKAP